MILLSASVSELQLMIDICVREFDKIDLCLNVKNAISCVLVGGLMYVVHDCLLAVRLCPVIMKCGTLVSR